MPLSVTATVPAVTGSDKALAAPVKLINGVLLPDPVGVPSENCSVELGLSVKLVPGAVRLSIAPLAEPLPADKKPPLWIVTAPPMKP